MEPVINEVTGTQHRTRIAQVLEDVQVMLVEKGGDYDNFLTFPDKMLFGDVSWLTLIWIKITRLISVHKRGDATFDSLDDILMDLVVYAVAYTAWRRAKHWGRDEVSRD